MIPMNQFLDGVTAFAVNDVIPSMPNGLPKFLAYGAVGAMKTNANSVLKPYENMLVSLGILSEDCTMVNEEAVRNALDEAFNNVPKVTLFGFTFDANDVSKLYRRMGI